MKNCIQLGYSNRNLIFKNSIENPTENGIRLYSSNYNWIFKNEISSSPYNGININGGDNRVFKNTITNTLTIRDTESI